MTMAVEALKLVKTKLTPLIAILCGIFTSISVFGQVTQIWTGGGDGTNIDQAANWGGTLPATSTSDTAEWNGLTTSNLFLINNTTAFASGPGNSGINLYLAGNQTNLVSINTTLATGQGFAVWNVTMDAGAASLILGGTNPAHLFYMPQRPGGAIHAYLNNSTNPGVINPWVRFISGGGAAYTLDFSGTGDWLVNNYLQPDNGGGALTVQVDGPGTVTWNPSGKFGSDSIAAVNVYGGTLALAAPHSKLTTRPFMVNGTFQFNAPSQAQTLSGIISGTGTNQVLAGTLTLSGQNTYSGDTVLGGGELIVNGAENTGVSGPLGLGTINFNGGTLGFSVNNAFDYSPRFSTADGQAIQIDTAGQNVTFASALTSSGGTLTKLGSGTLTLSGANTYSGATTVSAGKLLIQGSMGSGNISVANSAALGATGGSQITPATLTVGSTGSATLEFNNVTSTSTPLIAAGTVLAGGPITVNVNSGSFAVGQSYPLFSWSSGSAPAVALGTVVGAVGNLSTNGNGIQLNVTGLAYIWSGANSGNWDTTTANNWLQNDSPAIFADGSAALFDDTATGETNVTVNAPVSPDSTTVNSSAKIYTITSSGVNNIGGSGSLTKNGSSTLTLSGGVNSYGGATILSGGTLSVGVLGNGGSASDIGSASSSAGNLVFNGGALLYTGAAQSSDRLFTLNTAGGTIDSSGSGAIALNNTGAIALTGTGARTLTLTGSVADTNTLAASLGDNGGATALTKNGPGIWILTANNTNSGVTTIANGELVVGTGGANGSLGTGNVVDNGALDFNVSSTLTVGAISGTGSVTNDGTGTIILAANNGYSGGTTINAGTVQFGTGGASGTVFGNAPIVNNGTLIFNTTTPIEISGYADDISGTGNVIVRAGFVKSGNGNANSYTGWTEIDPGATFQPCAGQTGGFVSSVVTNNGQLKLVSQNTPATFGVSNNIVGTGNVWVDAGNQNAGQIVLAGTNTYTGGTFIGGAGIVLGDGINPQAGTILGNVVFTNTTGPTTETFSPNKRLLFNRPDDFTFTNNIISAVSDGSSAANSGSVEQMGPGVVTIVGNNSYPGETMIDAGMVLQLGSGGTSGTIGTGRVISSGTFVFNRSDDVTMNNVFVDNTATGIGALVKQGAGKLTLTATNTYTGTTTVSNGTLVVSGGAIGGDLYLEGGAIAAAPAGVVATLNVTGGMIIDSGTVQAALNTSLAQSNTLFAVGYANVQGTGTVQVVNTGPTLAPGQTFTLFNQPVQNASALTITGGGATWINHLDTDGSIVVDTVTVVTPPTLNFTQVDGNNLQFSWTGSYKLQVQTNNLSVGLSGNWTDYPGGGTSPVSVPIDVTKGAAFFRLAPAP